MPKPEDYDRDNGECCINCKLAIVQYTHDGPEIWCNHTNDAPKVPNYAETIGKNWKEEKEIFHMWHIWSADRLCSPGGKCSLWEKK